MNPHARLSFAALLFVCVGWSAPGQAGNLPASACRSMAHLPGELWLGHFTGGRQLTPHLIDWRDDYACFTSAAACRAWRNSLGRVYRHVDGWGTCLALRGGGELVVAKPVAWKPKRAAVRARY